jgi:hypothetical protein
MYYELYATTPKGKQALEKYYKDSQTIKGKFLAIVKIVSQEPYTLMIVIRTLRGLPQQAWDNETMRELVTAKTIITMKEYGAEIKDYEIR